MYEKNEKRTPRFAFNNREIKLFARFPDFRMLLDKKVILKSRAFGTAESTDNADFAQAPVDKP
ncbi:MAG: hypothetical protein ACI4S9_06235 [Christensenellales bacterium]